MEIKVKEILNKIIDGESTHRIGKDTDFLSGYFNEKYYFILYKPNGYYVHNDCYSIVVSEVITKGFFKNIRRASVKFLRGNYGQNSFNDKWMDEIISFEDTEELLIRLEKYNKEVIEPTRLSKKTKEENERKRRDNEFLLNALGEK